MVLAKNGCALPPYAASKLRLDYQAKSAVGRLRHLFSTSGVSATICSHNETANAEMRDAAKSSHLTLNFAHISLRSINQ
jgi:hypothetical protein